MTVDQILQGAAHVFDEHGYTRTTTNLIARRTGVSIGSVYQYFPNKDAILVGLLRRHIQQSTERILGTIRRALTHGRSLDDLLQELVTTVLDLHLTAPGLMQVLLNNAPRPDEIVQLLHRVEDEAADAVEAMLARHAGLRGRHAAHAAYVLVHVLEGLCHEFALHPPRSMDSATFISELVILIKGYLSMPCSEDSALRSPAR